LVLKWSLTALLLATVFHLVDGQALAMQVRQLQLWPMLLALPISVMQIALSAWRWRYTAARLALPLSLAGAIREYYLATFLNQVLPGGVLSDANRAWRHGGDRRARGAALRAVIIERFSGQVVLALVAVVSVSALPSFRARVGEVADFLGANGELGLAALVIALAAIGLRQRLATIARLLALPVFVADCRRALFSWPAIAWQWLSSFLVLLTYLTVFLLAARAVGIDRPAFELLVLAPLVLLAMLVPIGIAGWGVREGAAALVWAGAGLPPEEGVVIAVSYGVLVLISSLPGAWFLAGFRSPGRQWAGSRG
jgi:uncharacterized membrane protein YbhN (UPF0104 family)